MPIQRLFTQIAVKVRAWMSNHITHKTRNMVTYPCSNLKQINVSNFVTNSHTFCLFHFMVLAYFRSSLWLFDWYWGPISLNLFSHLFVKYRSISGAFYEATNDPRNCEEYISDLVDLLIDKRRLDIYGHDKIRSRNICLRSNRRPSHFLNQCWHIAD